MGKDKKKCVHMPTGKTKINIFSNPVADKLKNTKYKKSGMPLVTLFCKY